MNIPKKPDYVSENLWRLIYQTDFSDSERELWIMQLPKMTEEQKNKFEYILVKNEEECLKDK